MTMKKKKLFGILLTLALVLGLLPGMSLTAYAADSTVTNEESLRTALSAGENGTVTLHDNIQISSTLVITGTKTLDLNGYGIKMTGLGSVISVGSGAELTIIDSNTGNQVHKFSVAEVGTDAGLATVNDSLDSGYSTFAGGYITGANDVWGGGIDLGDATCTFTMRGGTIIGNKVTQNGGGVYLGTEKAPDVVSSCDGKFIMNGGAIIGNVASAEGNSMRAGGGVFLGRGATFTMSGGTIENNTAVNCGGGVYLSQGAVFTMSGGTISDNKAIGTNDENERRYGTGGGVCLDREGTLFTMLGGTIEKNYAKLSGGGVCNNGATFTMSDGTISGNTAAQSGGGVYLENPDATFTMSGGTISGNTATLFGNGVSAANGTFKLSGASGIEDSVNLGRRGGITIFGTLTNNTPIGVMVDSGYTGFGDGVFTSGWNAHMNDATPTDFFISETTGYNIEKEGTELKIYKPKAVPATVTANNRTDDGTEKPLVTVTGETTGGTMWYAIGENATDAPAFDGISDAADKKWSATIPTGTNAGTYYVWYKAVGDATHSDTEAACVTVTITDVPKTNSLYRIYNPNSGEHFFTTSAAEKNNLVKVGWRYEGVAWSAPKSGTPVLRLYNPNAGDHHYTTSTAEKNNLVKVGWRYEGVAFYSGGSKPIYRAYNPNAVSGAHHFTISLKEKNNIVKAGWRYEGVGFYTN